VQDVEAALRSFAGSCVEFPLNGLCAKIKGQRGRGRGFDFQCARVYSTRAGEGTKMALRKLRVPVPPNGQLADAFDVPVLDSNEKWAEVTLEDGTILRVKTIVSSAVRIEGHWDA